MKQAQIKIYQDSTELVNSLAAYETKLEFHSSVKLNKVIGTLVSEFFAFHSYYNSIGAKVADGRAPYLLQIEVDGIEVLNVGTLNRIARNKFKLNNSPRSRKLFAQRVASTLTFVLREVETKTIEQLTTELEAELSN